MIKRLGNVIYWIGSGIVVLLLIGAGFALNASDHAHNGDDRLFVAGLAGTFALLSYLTGLAIRYILSGPSGNRD